MRVLSLFDGISCGHVALERAGIPVEVYYASEIDKYAIQITQKNYPNTIQLGDVNKWQEWNIDFSSIDLLIGGSPCQGFSVAGKQLNFNDKRSKLFFVFVDILNHIKKVNPNIKFLLENVKMKKEYSDAISEILNCKPIEINSALVSAQNRKRYYWFNWGNKQYNLFGFPTCDIPQPKNKGILLKDILESGIAPDDKSRCIQSSIDRTTEREYFKKNQGQMIAEPICVNSQSGRADGLAKQPSMADRNYNIDGKAVVLSSGWKQNIAEPVIYQLPRGYNDGGIKKDKSPALTTSQWQYNNLLVDIADKNNGEMPKMFSLYNKQIVEDKSPTVTANSNVSLTHCGSVGIFSPIRLSEYEKSKGQGQRVYSVKDKSVVLNANGGGQGGKTGLYKIDLPDGDYIIRKLTPIECERLQTLPDNYTEGISNSQRYKCLGNGWTVDVIAHIFSFIGDKND